MSVKSLHLLPRGVSRNAGLSFRTFTSSVSCCCFFFRVFTLCDIILLREACSRVSLRHSSPCVSVRAHSESDPPRTGHPLNTWRISLAALGSSHRWLLPEALRCVRDSLGRTATDMTRGRESVTPVAVGRAGRSRGGADTCRGAGVHVGGRGSRAEVGDAGVVYEMGKVLVDAVGRVLRRRPGGGDG